MRRTPGAPSAGRAERVGSLAVGLLVMAAAAGIVLFASQRLLRADVEATVAAWAQSVRGDMHDFDAILSGEAPSRQARRFLATALKVGDVVGFRFFDAQGRLRQTSDNFADPDRVVRLRLRDGSSGRLRRDGAPARQAADIRRASVPVFGAGGKLRGVIEADVDVSGARALQVRWLGAMLGGILLLALLSLGLSVSALSSRARRARDAEARLAFLSGHDPLTGLANRTQLLESLAREIDLHAKIGRQLALHRVDIDRFQEINGLMGREAGDAMLREAAARLSGLAGRPEHVARVGDDEFVVVQPQTGDVRHAEIYAGRILNALGSVYNVAGYDVAPSVSVGVAVAPEHGTDAERLLASADLALARAKRAGRNDACVFNADMQASFERRIELQDDIRKAFGNHWFELHYQPQYDLASRRLNGFEALLCLKHPDRGMIPPAEFVPVAEETGLIVQLGEWTMREACRAASLWPEHLTLAVNLSPGQFRRSDVARSVRETLDTTCLPARRLAVEITESLLVESSRTVMEQLRRLRDMGVAIVMDDFGTGASSLDHLRRFPVDTLKIDRSLVHALGTGAGAESLVRSIVAVGRAFDARVLAEGVESVEQAHFLASHSCRHVQGVLFGRPVPLGDVAPIIMKDVRKTPGPADAMAFGRGARDEEWTSAVAA